MPAHSTRTEFPATTESAESPDQAIEVITAALRGEAVDGGQLARRGFAEALLEAVAVHGVGPLLHHALKSGDTDGWPEDILDTLAEAAREAEALEKILIEETRRLLAGLHAERVAPLMLGGTALAYALYSRPHLRCRQGPSLLVRQSAVADVVRILLELGYRRQERPPRDRVLGQDTYNLQHNSGSNHTLNLRWSISNQTGVAGFLNYRELRKRAVAIEAIGPGALGLCHEDALLQACLHRRTWGDEVNLTRLHDVHLLTKSMTPVEFNRFAGTVMSRRLGNTVRDAVAQSQRRFHTRLPSGTLDEHFPPAKLAEEARLGRGVSQGRQWLHSMLYDMQFLGQAREKLAGAFEHAFPPRAYMRQRYGADPSAWLPALYIRRGLKGVAALLRRSN